MHAFLAFGRVRLPSGIRSRCSGCNDDRILRRPRQEAIFQSPQSVLCLHLCDQSNGSHDAVCSAPGWRVPSAERDAWQPIQAVPPSRPKIAERWDCAHDDNLA